MARASYIYAVLDNAKHIIACFTVKHECKTFLERTRDPLVCWVGRFKDGIYDPDAPVKSVADFLAS